MVDVGQVVGGEVLPSGLPLLVRAAFDGETDRLDAILVIHPIYRLRKFEPLVTLADGVEQHGLYAAGNDVRKDDAGFLEKDSRPVDFFREPHRQLRDFQCIRRWNPEHCGSHVPVLRQNRLLHAKTLTHPAAESCPRSVLQQLAANVATEDLSCSTEEIIFPKLLDVEILCR